VVCSAVIGFLSKAKGTMHWFLFFKTKEKRESKNRLAILIITLYSRARSRQVLIKISTLASRNLRVVFVLLKTLL
jgi:hypothetical protein